MWDSIISARDDHCIDRSSPFRRIQPCSLLPVRDSNSIAKIPDTFCHDSKSFYEKFTFCHIVSNTSPVRANESVIIAQQKARCRALLIQRDFCAFVLLIYLRRFWNWCIIFARRFSDNTSIKQPRKRIFDLFLGRSLRKRFFYAKLY